jgi:hypothetical protein
MGKKGEKNTDEKNVKGKVSYKTFLKEIFDGTILTKGFLSRNFKMIFIVVAGILFYIGNHYGVIMDLNKIDKLQNDLADVKYEALTQSSLLMRESRQSKIRELVQEKELGLVDSITPPFVIEIDE